MNKITKLTKIMKAVEYLLKGLDFTGTVGYIFVRCCVALFSMGVWETFVNRGNYIILVALVCWIILPPVKSWLHKVESITNVTDQVDDLTQQMGKIFEMQNGKE